LILIIYPTRCTLTFADFLKRGVTISTLTEQFITDEKGNRIGVILTMDGYRKILEYLEELDSIRTYNAAKASGDEMISFDLAIREIEADRII
jgi:hypothetical protein